MRFWDSSALIALVVRQSGTEAVQRILADDPAMLVWRFSEVELRSGLARLRREEALTQPAFADALTRSEEIWSKCVVVTVFDAVAQRAKRLLGLHTLRAADALQLAAALTAVDEQPVGWVFVTHDRRLAEAAQREGFRCEPEPGPS
jgi:hypothetical protein